ncbi:MtrAB system histidine kinase MtrB [Cellulosimicrobium cellulans]|uniref:Sensor histidine kinase MtrB n=1 Tax=Cellulosimicrobium cellulans TaxID=1710 RepID=A0A4Y4E1P9_CELCE|nr:MtrAB system histidine kinase MtrB [Cellulosimicrobium cellulans]GED09765.1 two-component sensor histidine kinase [Cellulosimicrobium cellulans]
MSATAGSTDGRWRGLWRRVRRRARATARRVVWRWRSSMQLRVVTSALVVGVLTVGALGAYLTDAMRDGLYERRAAEVDLESAQSTQQARSTLDASPAANATEAQSLLFDLFSMLQSTGSSRDVFLWQAGGSSTVGFLDLSTNPQLVDLVTPEMREATVTADGEQYLQSVAIPVDPADPDSPVVPGIVVGSTVEVPVAGTYELYYLYDLEADQETLRFLQSVLLVGALVLLALLVGITALVTRQAVLPVRQAATVAERLADGRLDERLPVKGHDEMASLAHSFNEMARSLQDQIGRMEELSMLQRRFVSDVSHELRTPLTTIRMASEVLHSSREDFDPVSKRSTELLQTQLDRFEDLLADLLEISRFDAGAAVLDAERRDLRDVVNAAVDHAAPLAERKGVWLSVHLGDEPVTADVDPRRVERIVRNLVVNAIEHAEERPVEITVEGDGHAVAVAVRDHGVGMTADEVQHVFDRFWRADPARARTTGGTGLGLAISLEDAHLHGGWLEAWGRPGRGASFRLTLPRRAGIRLQSSPLPLVSEAAVGRGLPAEWSATTPVVEDVEGTAGPADLPSVTGGIPVVLPRDHDPHPGRGASPRPGEQPERLTTDDVQEAR